MKTLSFLTLLFLCLPGFVCAQRVISGTVTDSDGDALIGANIKVKGFSIGTVTDVEGTFELKVPEQAEILEVSYTGFQKKEVQLSISDSYLISLQEGVLLEEAIVTALGIKREEKTISYAIQKVGEADLNVVRQNNLSDALAGKVAGVQVLSTSGMKLGYGSDIRIRGVGSLQGPSRPLIIVDGTPVSRVPSMDDIESISVLKGPSAAALYGQRGDAGVIVVTTKQGKQTKGLGIEVNQSTYFESVNLLPDYQNTYAGGSFPELIEFNWQEGMPEEWKAFEGKSYHDYADDTSWGPKMEGQEYIPWYAWYPGTEHFGETARLVPQPDNIRNFYETGQTFYNNVNVQSSGDNYSLRISFTNQHLKGLIPNTAQNRNTLATKASIDFGDHITLGTSFNYITNRYEGNFNDGGWWTGNHTTGSFNQWFHRHLDMNMLRKLRDMRSPEGYLASWNHNNPGEYLKSPRDFYGGNYWYNFYAYLDHTENLRSGPSLNGNVNLTFKLSDKFRVTGYVRHDEQTWTYENKVYNILEQSATQTGERNSYNTGTSFSSEDNYEILATFQHRLGPDFSVEANVGGNYRIDRYKSISGFTTQGLNVPDLFTVANSVVENAPNEYRSEKKVRSLYARGSFGFRDMLYLDWSGRNDWSSALPVNKNSYFYPSVGLSFVFSELLGNSLPFLSFGKLRSNWARVGSDLGPYRLDLNYSVSSRKWGGNFIMNTPNQLIDPGIEPSLSSSYEVGMDLQFFFNRLGVSLTYFNENKINEILSIPVTQASGFSSKLINAGRIDRSGIELQFQAVPVKRPNFSWDIQINFAKVQNEIIELTEGVESQVSGSELLARVNEVGSEYGQIRGGGIQRDEQGRPVLTDQGLYQTQTNTYFGSIIPDFTGGVVSGLVFRNFDLRFSLDFSKGGVYFSEPNFWGGFSGISANTAAVNDQGMNVRDPIAAGGGVRVEGVNDEGVEVAHYVPARDYFQQFLFRRIVEPYVIDRSYVKLREVSLGYNIPVQRLGLGNTVRNAKVALVIRNPWLIYAKNRDFDPSEATSGFWDVGQFPSVRSIGFNVKLNF